MEGKQGSRERTPSSVSVMQRGRPARGRKKQDLGRDQGRGSRARTGSGRLVRRARGEHDRDLVRPRVPDRRLGLQGEAAGRFRLPGLLDAGAAPLGAGARADLQPRRRAGHLSRGAPPDPDRRRRGRARRRRRDRRVLAGNAPLRPERRPGHPALGDRRRARGFAGPHRGPLPRRRHPSPARRRGLGPGLYDPLQRQPAAGPGAAPGQASGRASGARDRHRPGAPGTAAGRPRGRPATATATCISGTS